MIFAAAASAGAIAAAYTRDPSAFASSTTYVVTLVLLFVTTQATWVVLVFPAWVFLISAYILVTHLRSGAEV